MTRKTRALASRVTDAVGAVGDYIKQITNPFLFAISSTEHKTKPKKSRGNTNSSPRAESF
jgi:hypothetical protein